MPSNPNEISTIFLDIGGVLLTNGWDHHMRQRAAEKFNLDYEELNERHHLTFDTYEQGKLSLDEYLTRVIFHEQRPFSRDEFRDFMFKQSEPYPDMIEMIRDLQARYHLRVGAISNEGRELTVYRIEEFDLAEFMDFFVSSCFVHYRKPDEDMYRIALDISQARPEGSVYIEDRPMFVDVAQGLGIHGIVHTSFDATRQALAELGLSL
jgi:putative hydrolase of the HAD superfamily